MFMNTKTVSWISVLKKGSPARYVHVPSIRKLFPEEENEDLVLYHALLSVVEEFTKEGDFEGSEIHVLHTDGYVQRLVPGPFVEMAKRELARLEKKVYPREEE